MFIQILPDKSLQPTTFGDNIGELFKKFKEGSVAINLITYGSMAGSTKKLFVWEREVNEGKITGFEVEKYPYEEEYYEEVENE